ncbi:hypothetical protein JCM19238_5610 [Vibrio ponticus]|nr:hypothetical protein JCM19238_5610 [Vibrio ponticus]
MADQLQAIRESLLWILPCLMIISLTLFVASLGEFLFGKNELGFKRFLSSITSLMICFPFY